MRVAGVRAYGNDGQRVRDDAHLAKLSADPLLEVKLSERFTAGDSSGGFFKGRLRDRIDGTAGGAMGFQLTSAPDRLEFLHEVGRAHHLASLSADELHRACVDH